MNLSLNSLCAIYFIVGCITVIIWVVILMIMMLAGAGSVPVIESYHILKYLNEYVL